MKLMTLGREAHDSKCIKQRLPQKRDASGSRKSMVGVSKAQG